MNTEMVFVRTESHRAREKLKRLLGYKPQSYYSQKWYLTGSWEEIPKDKLTEAIKIKGVREVKQRRTDLRKCWSSSDG